MADDDIGRFLDLIYEDIPDDLHLLIWTSADKASAWFTTTAKAAEHVRSLEEQNIYYGVGLSPQAFGRKRRCPADKIAGIFGFYADIDVAGEAHKKKNLPPTLDDALGLVKGFGWDPSIIVHSGHGIQAYWIFKEPWVFDTDDERLEAMDLSKRVHQAVLLKARAKKWVVDSVFDLSRVLRVPGTWNVKEEPHVQAKILEVADYRYNPSDLNDILLPLEIETVKKDAPGQRKEAPDARSKEGEGLTLRSDADAPYRLMKVLLANNPQFEITWKRQRELPSQSEYDLSLANYAVAAGWSDQEIADMILAHRRIHGQDINKALRPDYMAGTIMRARDTSRINRTEKDLQSGAALAGSKYENPAALKETLSTRLGFKIIRIVRFMEDPPTFLLETDMGEIELGDIKQLTAFVNFKNHIAGATKHMITGFTGSGSRAVWDATVQAMLNICEDQEVTDESKKVAMIEGWVVEYVDEMGMEFSPKEIRLAYQTGKPFQVDGIWLIAGDEFYSWTATRKFNRMRPVEVNRLLKRMGCHPVKKSFSFENVRRQKRMWKVPADVFLGTDEEPEKVSENQIEPLLA